MMGEAKDLQDSPCYQHGANAILWTTMYGLHSFSLLRTYSVPTSFIHANRKEEAMAVTCRLALFTSFWGKQTPPCLCFSTLWLFSIQLNSKKKIEN